MLSTFVIAVVAALTTYRTERGISKDQLAPATVDFLPLEETVEANRAAAVEGLLGPAFSVLADPRQMSCFSICGCARPLHRATAVS